MLIILQMFSHLSLTTISEMAGLQAILADEVEAEVNTQDLVGGS